jgi:signal transduction histidine kinase
VHELNNPLTSIIAYSEYLTRKAQARLPEPEATDDLERLRRIQEAAGRILRFSRDLVAYARPSNEIPGPVSLVEVVD